MTIEAVAGMTARESRFGAGMVLFLHNRYRTPGGEERVLADLIALVRERLGEDAELLERDSSRLGRGAATRGLLQGGLEPGEVAAAVRLTGARVVHAHNLHPSLGWRSLAAARAGGARTVLHLHNFRLVCAIGVCYTRGADCTRCHGANTLAGARLNCRGSLPEALVYAAALAGWQRRLLAQADAVIVPSRFAAERLRELGAPLAWERVHVVAPPMAVPSPATADGLPLRPDVPPEPSAPGRGDAHRPYALVASRLAPEKGVDVAIDACRIAGIGLVIAGDGPDRSALEARAGADVGAGASGASEVRFMGRVEVDELARLRAGAAVALVPSRAGESFGLAAAEALAAGVPVIASRVGALPELLDADSLVAPGDPQALARAIGMLAAADPQTAASGRAARAQEKLRELCDPARVAARLAAVYDASPGDRVPEAPPR
jgi:glycosyltransferase involved in cell wall biosynthesis